MGEMDPKEIKALMEAKGMNPDRHNWLYSFMNRTFGRLETTIYLVAYCKMCDQTLSVLVPIDKSSGKVRINKAGVPKYGCNAAAEA